MEVRKQIVELLVKAGTDVNKRTINGVLTLCFMRDALLKPEAPLHQVAANGNER